MIKRPRRGRFPGGGQAHPGNGDSANGGKPMTLPNAQQAHGCVTLLRVPFRRVVLAVTAAASVLGLPSVAQSRVTRMIVDQVTSPNFEGQSFGDVGQYEKIIGRLVGEVDPAQAENRLIQDIDLAPRNARGMVEYTADFLLLKPIDMARGSGILQENIPNRGRTLGLAGNVGSSQSNNPTTKADARDGFLMRRGYSILFIGWQADLAPGDGRIRLQAPVATDKGQPITGPFRMTYTVEKPTSTLGLEGNGPPQVAYEAAHTDDPDATLRRRGDSISPWVDVPRSDWAFAECASAAFP